MIKTAILSVMFFFILTYNSISSDLIKIGFSSKDRHSQADFTGCAPLKHFRPGEGTTVMYFKKTYPFVLPDMKNCSDTAWTYEFFTGKQDPNDRTVNFIVGNYKSDTTYIWVDANSNNDFRDDSGPYVISKSHPKAYIRLNNYYNPEAHFDYLVRKFDIVDSAQRASYDKYYTKKDTAKGNITTDMDYWLLTERVSIIYKPVVIYGDSAVLGINDWDCNGKFNDMDTVSEDNFDSDRICIAKYSDTTVSNNESDGAVKYLPGALIKLGKHVYEVKSIEETGKYIVLSPSDKKYDRLSTGDKCPDLKFTLFNEDTTSLLRQMKAGKYNVVYVWATWCHGCITHTIPLLMELDSVYKDKINIIALHHWMGYGKGTSEWTESKKIPWVNGVETPEIDKKLLVGGAAGIMILFDENLNVVKFGLSGKELKDILSKKF